MPRVRKATHLASRRLAEGPGRFSLMHGKTGPGRNGQLFMLCAGDRAIPEGVVPAGFQVRAVEESETASRAEAQHAVWQPQGVSTNRLGSWS